MVVISRLGVVSWLVRGGQPVVGGDQTVGGGDQSVGGGGQLVGSWWSNG